MEQQRRGPGAMTMAMRAVGTAHDRAEVIRLGLVTREGRLEERLVTLERPVILGPDAGTASFVVPGLAGPHVLVTQREGRVVLHVLASMKARIVTPAGPREIEGRDEDVVLDARGRGKLVIGGQSVLFQLMAAPPKRLVPALPAAVRGGLLRQIDAIFTAVVAVSFLGHFGFVVYLDSADFPMSASLAAVPDHVAELIFADDVAPPDPPVEDDDVTPTEDTSSTDDTTPTEVARDDSPRTPRADHAPSTQSTPSMSEDEAIAVGRDAATSVSQLLIGASGGPSAFNDVLAGGAPGLSAEEVMASVPGGVAIATNTQTLRERDGNSGPAGPTDLGHLRQTQTTGPVQEGRDVVEHGPTIAYHPPAIDEVEIDDGTGVFDERAVVRMIQTRRAQITACYEHAILSDPTLRGRVEIQMTIEESGSVSGVRTVENGMGTDVVARCIETRVRGFRFSPGPTGGSVQFRFPFVFEQQR
jgi:hypothetical protein